MNFEKKIENLKKIDENNKKLFENSDKENNQIIIFIFDFIKDELQNYNGKKSYLNILSFFNYLLLIMENYNNLNKKLIARKLTKTYELIEKILNEKEKSSSNYELLTEHLEDIKSKIDSIYEKIPKENLHFLFINFLIEEIRNFDYVEKTFEKIPAIVNSKDQNNKPLINNLLHKLYKYIFIKDTNNILYYENVISLVISEDTFKLNYNEKQELLTEIYNFIFKISETKKEIKKYKNEINWLNNLIKIIKTTNKNKVSFDDLVKKYHIKTTFPYYILEEAKLLKPATDYETDTIYVGDYLISIDKKSPTEIDDLLSCSKLENNNYLLGVHIASVLSYMDYESAIIDEALSRGQNIYLKKDCDNPNENNVISIFPFNFSSNIASLLPNKYRFARSYYFEIDKDGNLIKEEFFKTIVNSNKKCNFNEVNTILAKGSENKELENTIYNLKEVTDILEKKFKTSMIYEEIKENIINVSNLKVKSKEAEKIVYYATLLTGNRVANYFATKKYPFIYRVHKTSKDYEEKLHMLYENISLNTNNEKYKQLANILETAYPKGSYSLEGSHKGLNLEHYCHCTSTLRRSSDILVEHALDVCYNRNPSDKELKELEEELKNRIPIINEKLNPIEWFASEYNRSYQKKKK